MRGFKEFYPTLADASRAAIALGIVDAPTYKKGYRQDVKLPSKPEMVYAEWKGWRDFCGRGYYESLSDAAKAVRMLGVKSRKAYVAIYKEDPRLHRRPNEYYPDWTDWYEFLDVKKPKHRNHYFTIYEASHAAKKLGIKGAQDYKKNYYLDPGLPCYPAIYYRDYWVGWSDFLSGTIPVVVYETLSKASDAVRSLNIHNEWDYREKYTADPWLPEFPEVTYKSEWQGWIHFIIMGSTRIYSTLIEAQEAVQKIVIKTRAQYTEFFSQDPKLPVRPDKVYSKVWVSWNRFLQISTSSPKYHVIEDAQSANYRLGITSSHQYRNAHKFDPALPSAPSRFYRNQWSGWISYLIPLKLDCLDHIAHAAKVLGIKSALDYRKKYKLCPRLPAHPERVFSDEWIGWSDFLGVEPFYSYVDASEVAQLAGITTQADYVAYIKKTGDRRLPRTPAEVYISEWTSWHIFLGKPEPYISVNIRTPFLRWGELIVEYKKIARGGGSKENTLCRFVRDYVQKQNLGDTPELFLTRMNTDRRPFMLFMAQACKPGGERKMLTSVNGFLNFVIKSYLTEEDEETGELVVALNAKNPFLTIELELEGSPKTLDESNKPALAYHFVTEIKNWMLPPEAKSFSDLKHLHEFDADWVDVDEELIDLNDPNCVIRQYAGKVRVWCPIYWMHAYVCTAVPARGRQIAYNDSGEGDEQVLDISSDGQAIWIKNDHALSGVTNNQSFIRSYPGQELGMHFTTNKTSASGAGLDVPWIPVELVYWLVQLRKWQSKYNPITRAMPWVECNRTTLNEKQRRAKGANCFLFRDVGSEECGFFSSRISNRLAAALFNVQQRGIKLAGCIGSPRALGSYSSIYTPHSMRVSLITAYILEFGLPMSIVMKIAGHSSIVMGIYYVKVNSESLRKRFDEGEKLALKNKAMTVQSMLEQNRVDEIQHEFVSNSEESLIRLSKSGSGGFLFRDYGVCPFAGSRCNDGGDFVGQTGVRSPVQNGYLGRQNCPRCRHFLSGPVFLGGLISLQNEICLQARIQYEKYSDIEVRINELNKAVDACDDEQLKSLKLGKKYDSGDRDFNESRIRKLRSELEGAAMKLDMFLCDIQSIAKLVKQCEALLNKQVHQKDSSNLPQLIFQSGHEIHLAAEETSHFHQLSEVCENAEIYESASASLALSSRSQMLDKMFLLNNFRPVMCLLDTNQQLVIGNQLTKLVLSRLKSWERIDALVAGKIHMVDLADDERITEADLKALFRSDLKKIR